MRSSSPNSRSKRSFCPWLRLASRFKRQLLVYAGSVFSILKKLRSPKSGPAAYDVQTCAIMARVLKHDSVCVDVGAHVGSVLVEMLKCAPQGRHFAFEPLPQCFLKLQKRFGKRPGVELFQLALAEEAGSSSFQHVVSRPTYSGLRRRRYEREEEVVAIEVQRARLDDVIPRASAS